MSSEVAEASEAEVEETTRICEYCGCVIDEAGQRCDALDKGRCQA